MSQIFPVSSFPGGNCASCNNEMTGVPYQADCCRAYLDEPCVNELKTIYPPQCLCGKNIKKILYASGAIYEVDKKAQKAFSVRIAFLTILAPLLWYNPYFYKNVNQIHYKGVLASIIASALSLSLAKRPLNLEFGKVGNCLMNAACITLAAFSSFTYLQIAFQYPNLAKQGAYNFASDALSYLS